MNICHIYIYTYIYIYIYIFIIYVYIYIFIYIYIYTYIYIYLSTGFLTPIYSMSLELSALFEKFGIFPTFLVKYLLKVKNKNIRRKFIQTADLVISTEEILNGKFQFFLH